MSGPATTVAYRDVVVGVRELVARVVPEGAVIAVVSRGDDDLVTFPRHTGRHVPETADGRYAGYHPATGVDAVKVIEAARRHGATFLALPATSAWWLEHYESLRAHLGRNYVLCAVDEMGSALWDLRDPRSSALLPIERMLRRLIPASSPVAMIGDWRPRLDADVTMVPLNDGASNADVAAVAAMCQPGAWFVVPPWHRVAVEGSGLRQFLDASTRVVFIDDELGEVRVARTETAARAGAVRQRSSREGTVLYVSHGHPRIRPGGAEGYAVELHEAMRDAGPYDAVLLSRAPGRRGPLGGVIEPVTSDGSEWRLHTDEFGFDALYQTCRDKRLYTEHLRSFLRAIGPDVVHVHQLHRIGLEFLREITSSAPQAAIVMTLHDFLPICHRDGQLVRTVDEARCTSPEPHHCHGCFPDVGEGEFRRRRAFVQAQLNLVDRFIAPSLQLVDRYVQWGIARDRFVAEDYGRRGSDHHLPAATPARNRFAFFGQLTPFKGAHVLLAAMAELQDRLAEAAPQLIVHGANLDLQPGAYQRRIRDLLDRTAATVTFRGPYDAEELPYLMADIDWVVVPSTWWENSPLVIQEAFAHGRPVICSNIGGMAEKVIDGVNGLHARVNDSAHLAEVIHRASSTPALWDQLRGGVPPVHRMAEHLQVLGGCYSAAIAMRRGRS